MTAITTADDSLKKKILSDPLVSGVFNDGIEAYLVGGYLRDLLRGDMSRDIDFVVRGGPADFARRVFPGLKKSFVEFRKVLLVRVIAGGNIVDFSELGGNIEDDLKRRDFTMNAIAWSPATGIIDPLGGAGDIRKKKIRAVSQENFMDDPLRMLRAYRFSAELGWKIDDETRAMIRKLKNRIKQSADERITLEIFKLLNSEGHIEAVRKAYEDSLLHAIIAIKNSMLEDNIKVVSRFESFLEMIPEESKNYFDRIFSQELSYRGFLRTACLLRGADLKKSRLRLSGAISKKIALIGRLLKKYEKKRAANVPALFDLFVEAGDALIEFAMLTRNKRVLKEAERFAGLPLLVDGEKVMKLTGLEAGPAIGPLLREMKRLQFIRKIRHINDAVKWLKERSFP